MAWPPPPTITPGLKIFQRGRFRPHPLPIVQEAAVAAVAEAGMVPDPGVGAPLDKETGPELPPPPPDHPHPDSLQPDNPLPGTSPKTPGLDPAQATAEAGTEALAEDGALHKT